MSAPIILGVDPGFANMGWARVALSIGSGELLIDAGVIRTEKGRAARLASEDNVARARLLWRGLALRSVGVAALAVEAQSWPRNAGAVAKIGIAWGVVSAFAEMHGLPLVHVTPMGLKRAVAGNAKASKDEVLHALENRRGFDLAAVLARVPRSLWEHPVDAAGAVVAALDTEIIRTLRVAYASALSA